MTMRNSKLFASAAIGAMLVSGTAYAQQADTSASAAAAESNASFTDAIIVTARRRAEDASRVPIAITAFSGEQLVAKGIQNSIDLVKITPGLNIAGGGTKANPFIVLRGQSKAVTGTGSPGVITYINDVPLPGYGSLIQTYDMENIQVLKGPQGTLFGRNSIGGALLTVTKAPSHELEGYVTGEIAQYNFHQIEGAVNLPILKDKVALRLAAQIGHDDGATKTFAYSSPTVTLNPDFTVTATPGQLIPNSHNVDEFNTKSFRASLLIEPTDWIRNVTVADYSELRGTPSNINAGVFNNGYQGAPPALYFLPPSIIAGALTPVAGAFFANAYSQIVGSLAQCGTGINCDINIARAAVSNALKDRVAFVTQDPWEGRTTIKGISNTTTISLGENHQIKNIFAIRTTNSFSDTSLSGLAIPIINTASQTRLRQTTEELQFSGSFLNDDLKYTLGGLLYNEKPDGLGGYQALEVNAFFGLSHELSTTYLHNSSKAIYGQVDYSLDHLIPGLSLTAGARQTWDTQSACTVGQTISPFGPQMVLKSRDNQDGLIPSEADCRNTATNILPKAKFNKLTYTLGANWQLTSSAMVYVVHRRGYRAGGYNTPLFGPFLATVQTYQPETLTDFEVGTKLRWKAGEMHGSLELAAFTGKDKGTQLPINTSNLGGAGTCVPEATGTAGQACTTTAQQGGAFPVGTPGVLVPIAAATTTDNAAELTIRGIEAAATFSPIPAVTFSASAAYLDVNVDKIQLNTALAALLRAAGRPATTIALQGQPTWTANGGITINAPGKVLGGDLSFSADYHYGGKFRQVDIDIPSTEQVDARLTLSDIGDSNLSAAIWVRNLTDHDNYQGGGATSPAGIGAQSYILAPPRTVGMSLTFRFGNN